MTTAPLTPELLEAAPGFASRLRVILTGLGALIAHAFLKDPRYVAIILPLHRRLMRATQRIERAMARVAAGTKPRASRPGQPSGTRPVNLPTRHAWLLAALRHEGAFYRNQLERLLDQPEAAALLAQSPHTVRILRPICHMLGLRHACVPALPRRRPAPRPAAPEPALLAPPRPLPARSVPAIPPQSGPDWVTTRPGLPPLCARLLDRWPWCTLSPSSFI